MSKSQSGTCDRVLCFFILKKETRENYFRITFYFYERKELWNNAPCHEKLGSLENNHWKVWQPLKSLTTTGCSNNWLFIHNKLFRLLVFRTLTLVLPLTIPTRLFYPTKWRASEPDENPTRTLTWKSLDFLNHIKCRTNDDRFPLPLWETWFCSSLGVPIPALIGPAQQLNSVYETPFIMSHLGTIWRHAKLNQRLYRFTTGVFISWVPNSFLWVTQLRSTR